MFRQVSFIKSMVIILFFSLFSMSSEIYASSKEDLVKITLHGYMELEKDNHDKAYQFFKEALNIAYKSRWPTYSSRTIRKNLIENIEKHEHDWQGSDKQKILGLMQVYHSVKHYFAGFEIVPELNWDELVIEYIPEVIEVKNIEEYYQLLKKLISNLSDNHTRIRMPKTIEENIDRPPISIEYIENKFVITKVKGIPKIKEKDVYPGLEIRKVEGVLTKEFFEENKLPYMALSKVQRERLYKTFNLLSGEKNTKVGITLLDLNGSEREVILTRNFKIYKEEEVLPKVEFKDLESGIVYFNFRAFWPLDTVVQKFEQEFNKLDLSKTKGMIFDVRYNRGGNSTAGDVIVSHIIDKPVKGWASKVRVKGFIKVKISNPLLQFGARIMASLLGKEWYEGHSKIKPSSGKRYLGPIVVLTSRYTGSAAEVFVAAIRESKRAKIIGETTCGGTGNPLYSILPGYGTLRVCVNVGAFANGGIWQGVGIEPDIDVPRTVEDIYRGYDSVLAKGLEVLNAPINRENIK